LVHSLHTKAAPRNRDEERRKAQERSAFRLRSNNRGSPQRLT
jgi:hypothetical protein